MYINTNVVREQAEGIRKLGQQAGALRVSGAGCGSSLGNAASAEVEFCQELSEVVAAYHNMFSSSAIFLEKLCSSFEAADQSAASAISSGQAASTESVPSATTE